MKEMQWKCKCGTITNKNTNPENAVGPNCKSCGCYVGLCINFNFNKMEWI